ncbi:MAG: HEAT repeat domain-containing protein [Microcoleus sp. SU_5_6]|nr:HEAT repeat domain-containing protein [Microcoleus sp. SU_5_6]
MRNITASTSQEYDNLADEIRVKAVVAVAITWKDDPETLPLLKQLAQYDDNSDVRCTAVQQIARGWKDDPETLPMLKERVRSDDNWPCAKSSS